MRSHAAALDIGSGTAYSLSVISLKAWLSILATVLCAQAAAESARVTASASGTRHIERRTPVLFLPSLGGSASQWRAQIEHLGGERRSLVIAWGGDRGIELPTGQPSVPALAQRLRPMLDSPEWQRFVIVAHSAGASIAMALANEAPDRVRGLLLCDPVGDFRAVPEEEFSGFLAGVKSENHRLVLRQFWESILQASAAGVSEVVMRDMERTPQATFVYTYQALRTFDPAAALGTFHGSTRVVISSINDAPYSLHKVVPKLSATLVSPASHWVHMDRPVEFNRVLDELLMEVDAEPAR